MDVAIGAATSNEEEDLYDVLKRADKKMYAEKALYKKNINAACAIMLSMQRERNRAYFLNNHS